MSAEQEYISSAEEARRIMDLPRKYKIALDALTHIAFSDYRGNQSYESQYAQDILREINK